jgi:hypothetical protein
VGDVGIIVVGGCCGIDVVGVLAGRVVVVGSVILLVGSVILLVGSVDDIVIVAGEEINSVLVPKLDRGLERERDRERDRIDGGTSG